LELLRYLQEDMAQLGARNLHELLRVWELRHRFFCAEAHVRHVLFREETRWPGYYYRGDFPRLDDANWRCFTTSRYQAAKNEWELEKVPYAGIVP
ncbi:MAG: adenylyl-sulfate reductase subunit alpha, partial [Polyangiaceae bacterium]